MAEGSGTFSAHGVGFWDGHDSACRILTPPMVHALAERKVQRLMNRFASRSNSGSDWWIWKQKNDGVFSWVSLVGVVFSLQILP